MSTRGDAGRMRATDRVKLRIMTTYLARLHVLQQELAEIQQELQQPGASAMLKARERSVLRSMRWYSSRLEKRPARQSIPTSKERVQRPLAAG